MAYFSTFHMRSKYHILFLFTQALSIATTWADEDYGRLYTTREEQLDVGRKHELTDWLTLTGLVELEWESKRYHSVGTPKNQARKGSTSVQIGSVVKLLTNTQFETVTQFDSDDNNWTIEEALLAIDLSPWELNIGKQQLPFGKYISHFASGPMIEFGEINEKALSVDFDVENSFDLTTAIYFSDRTNNTYNKHGWVISFETSDSRPLSAGISYLSNLANSDRHLLTDINNGTANKVHGLSGYIFWRNGITELSLEYLAALNTYHTIDQNFNRPAAWNIEFNQVITPTLDYSLRLEGSRKLLNEPARKAGIGLNYRFNKYTVFSIEFLREKYDKPTNPINEHTHEAMNSLHGQLSAAF